MQRVVMYLRSFAPAQNSNGGSYNNVSGCSTGTASACAAGGNVQSAQRRFSMHRSALLLFSLTAIASAQVSITEYPVAGGLPSAITAGPDGAIWFADWHGNQIGRITTGGTLTEYAIGQYPYLAAFGPPSITAGPDGAVWFVDSASQKIGRITTSGTITEY